MRYAVIPVPEQAPSYLPGLALMATTPGRRRLSRPHRTGGRGVAKDCDTKAAWRRAYLSKTGQHRNGDGSSVALSPPLIGNYR
jgi:hypothetical protein